MRNGRTTFGTAQIAQFGMISCSARAGDRHSAAEQGQLTRARLMDAAAELIAERGWGAVTTRIVAERAGLRPGFSCTGCSTRPSAPRPWATYATHPSCLVRHKITKTIFTMDV